MRTLLSCEVTDGGVGTCCLRWLSGNQHSLLVGTESLGTPAYPGAPATCQQPHPGHGPLHARPHLRTAGTCRGLPSIHVVRTGLTGRHIKPLAVCPPEQTPHSVRTVGHRRLQHLSRAFRGHAQRPTHTHAGKRRGRFQLSRAATQLSGTQNWSLVSRFRHLGPSPWGTVPSSACPRSTHTHGRQSRPEGPSGSGAHAVRRVWSPGLGPHHACCSPGVTEAPWQALGDVKTAGGTEGPSLVPRPNQETPARSPRCGL